MRYLQSTTDRQALEEARLARFSLTGLDLHTFAAGQGIKDINATRGRWQTYPSDSDPLVLAETLRTASTGLYGSALVNQPLKQARSRDVRTSTGIGYCFRLNRPAH